jgi:hypothetical protein
MRRPIRLAFIAALGLAAAAVAVAPAHAAGDTFSCRGSLARVEGTPGGLLDMEPVVANAPNDPCAAEDASLLDVLNPLSLSSLGSVRALYAQTNAEPRSSEARSGAAQAIITLPGAPTIRAAALTSQATATCGSGSSAPALAGSSNVLFLQIGNDAPLVNVDAPTTIPLPGGGQVVLNQQTTANNEVTQRALRVEVPGVATVTVAESRADFHGNPCSTGTSGGGGGGSTPPQCSDERDNDKDGLIDYPNDPGCASPQDDDETNDTPPQCSDGTDNDGDGYIDYPTDPGCTDRSDDDETNPSNPECSDGVDNDGDRRVDFPADNGCTSPTDDDEAAGFMTGGGGYDETDKKISNEDSVTPGSSLRFGEVLPCDLGGKPGPNLTVSWHDPQLVEQLRLDSLTRAFCRNDPDINPGRPKAEFDTYVGAGTGTLKVGSVTSPVTFTLISIDRGEPGAPPVTGVDFFQITVMSGGNVVAQGVGTLDEGNIQAHTPGSFREKKTAN